MRRATGTWALWGPSSCNPPAPPCPFHLQCSAPCHPRCLSISWCVPLVSPLSALLLSCALVPWITLKARLCAPLGRLSLPSISIVTGFVHSRSPFSHRQSEVLAARNNKAQLPCFPATPTTLPAPSTTAPSINEIPSRRNTDGGFWKWEEKHMPSLGSATWNLLRPELGGNRLARSFPYDQLSEKVWANFNPLAASPFSKPRCYSLTT